MKDQATLTRMLRETSYSVRNKLLSLLEPPLYLYLSIHDTGTQARIELRAEGHKTITVWEGSVWRSSRYEFNDKDKVLGLNPDADFAHAKVEAFFADVERLMNEEKTAAQRAAADRAEREAREHAEALAAYRQMI